MNSEKNSEKKEAPERTFIEEARRAQIIQCTADVIAELGYGRATMAAIAKRARIAKSVISYHFADKSELMHELVRTAVGTYTSFVEPRLLAESSAPGKINAYLVASADYMIVHRSLNLAVLEIAFVAVDPQGRPLAASIRMETEKPSLEDILGEGQASGHLREFDVPVMAGLLRSAVTHTLTMAQRKDPDVDLKAFARELGTAFDLATRSDRR